MTNQKTRIIFTLCLLLVVVGLSGWAWWGRVASNPETTSTAELDMSNWKTYRNEELGFEFKYPDQYVTSSSTETVVNWQSAIVDPACVGSSTIDQKEYRDQLSLIFYPHVSKETLIKNVESDINENIFSYELTRVTAIIGSSLPVYALDNYRDGYGATTNYLRLIYSPTRSEGIILKYQTVCRLELPQKGLVDDLVRGMMWDAKTPFVFGGYADALKAVAGHGLASCQKLETARVPLFIYDGSCYDEHTGFSDLYDPPITISVGAGVSSTADWLEYRGNGWGIHYPKDWEVISLPDPKAGIALRPKDYHPIKTNDYSYEGLIYINEIKNEKNLSIVDLYKTLDDTSRLWPERFSHHRALLANHVALVFPEIITDGLGYRVVDVSIYNKVLSMAYLFNPQDKKDNEFAAIFNSIVSTLQTGVVPQLYSTVCRSPQLAMQISFPSTWTNCIFDNQSLRITTDYKPYAVQLLFDVKEIKDTSVSAYKKSGPGWDYSPIPGGEVFRVECGGPFDCTGVIMNGHIYEFIWDIKSSQKPPKDLQEIWIPNNDVSQELIWEIMKTIRSMSPSP